MIISAPVMTELEVEYIKIDIPIECTEEIPENLPGFDGDSWSAIISLVDGAIRNWPKNFGSAVGVFQKVTGCGNYTLLDEQFKSIATRSWYVPEFFPAGCSDYIDICITEEGVIKRWEQPTQKDLVDFFFPTNDDDA